MQKFEKLPTTFDDILLRCSVLRGAKVGIQLENTVKKPGTDPHAKV